MNEIFWIEALFIIFGFVYDTFRTVAVDMRGYNLSDQPIGRNNYKLSHVAEDLRALIEHLSKKVINLGPLKNVIDWRASILHLLQIVGSVFWCVTTGEH